MGGSDAGWSWWEEREGKGEGNIVDGWMEWMHRVNPALYSLFSRHVGSEIVENVRPIKLQPIVSSRVSLGYIRFAI